MARHIMVVDPDPLTRALISAHLTAHSATATEFDAVEPALAALRASHFDLLITELHLPTEPDGLRFLDEARTHHPDLPIIVITEAPPPKAHLRTADAIVEKPFHPDELLGEVLYQDSGFSIQKSGGKHRRHPPATWERHPLNPES